MKGVTAIVVFLAVSLLIPIVELNRIVDPPPEIVTGGFSDPLLIFLFGAYSGLSQFQSGYWITESISHASTLPFLALILLNIVLFILLTIGKISPKVAFPASFVTLILWVWFSVQIYAPVVDWIVRPVLITPIIGSILTLIFVQDIASLRKMFSFNG